MPKRPEAEYLHANAGLSHISCPASPLPGGALQHVASAKQRLSRKAQSPATPRADYVSCVCCGCGLLGVGVWLQVSGVPTLLCDPIRSEDASNNGSIQG